MAISIAFFHNYTLSSLQVNTIATEPVERQVGRGAFRGREKVDSRELLDEAEVRIQA
ncbi:hypothetical protein Ferpe_1570 [Fervidobacterium pennivorans DSM 9078]|uniref:Uncharacterized protein n=1 Tax=Fervidobacterium pennivorans (strain DSM 9078 / Ven5) TaxID=771875 RepID=H9UDP1_FERPD|nr:hypothetical protein Ferpe_1570 [Fervidobacterium pennivorans DSM 9078]